MNSYIKHHEWLIIEEGFHPEYNRTSESIFALGNGRMGQRANFEERYTGDSTTPIKPVLAGGRLDTPNILPKY